MTGKNRIKSSDTVTPPFIGRFLTHTHPNKSGVIFPAFIGLYRDIAKAIRSPLRPCNIVYKARYIIRGDQIAACAAVLFPCVYHALHPHSDTFIQRHPVPMHPEKRRPVSGILYLAAVKSFTAAPCPGNTINIIVNAVFNTFDFKAIQAAVIGDAFVGHAIFFLIHGLTRLYNAGIQAGHTVTSLI